MSQGLFRLDISGITQNPIRKCAFDLSNGIWPRLFETVGSPKLQHIWRCQCRACLQHLDKLGAKAITSASGQVMEGSEGIHSADLSIGRRPLFGSSVDITVNAPVIGMFRQFRGLRA